MTNNHPRLLLDAIQYANEKHAGQTRKVTGVPTITHPLAVSYLVASYKRSKRLPELLAAAVLHDVLEDTDATKEELTSRFTPLVASLVEELTNDTYSLRLKGKLEYQKTKLAAMSSYSLLIKLCDRLHNISDKPTKKMVVDTVALLTHIKSARELTATHRRIVYDIEQLCLEQIQRF